MTWDQFAAGAELLWKTSPPTVKFIVFGLLILILIKFFDFS